MLLELIDPKIAPGVSVPATNGINLEEVNKMIETIIKKKNIVKSIDLVEYNPSFDIDNKTKIIAMNILNKLLNNF